MRDLGISKHDLNIAKHDPGIIMLELCGAKSDHAELP